MIIRRKASLIRRKASLILGIETSCDETSASLVKNGTKILSNIVASSQELHIKTGGIIPEMAAREQISCIIPVINETMKQFNNLTIDSLAVTVGPGLIGSLLIGVETAKTLAYLWHKPIIPVNHLLAHIYANWLISEHSENSERQMVGSSDNLKVRNSDFPSLPSFPNIALIVSGGHTELILMKDHGKYEWLGGTRDDAAGECFDKIARLLGLGYPGGPAISAAAARHAELVSASSQRILKPPPGRGPAEAGQVQDDIRFPRPMISSDDFDFSFSGLKTAVLREVIRLKALKQFGESRSSDFVKNRVFNNLTIQQLAFEVQEAITDVLVEKAVRAAKEYNVKNILLAGGVAANNCLRQKFKVQSLKFKVKFFAPAKNLCTDNAAAIASCAFFNYKPTPWQKIQVFPSLNL